MSRRLGRFAMETLMLPLRLIGLVIGGAYNALFGWSDLKISKHHEDVLIRDLREELQFLLEQGAKIVPDASIKHPRSFDYAVVIVAVDRILFRFVRGRGELRVQIAYESADNWSELPSLLSILGVPGWESFRPFASLAEVAAALKIWMGQIRQAFSGTEREVTERQLSDMHHRERVAAKQLENEINRRLYS